MQALIDSFHWFTTTFPTLSMAIGLLLFPLLPLIISVAMFVYWERKVIGWMHVRMGPNQIGPLGLLQAFADVVKLLLKEVLLPANANKGLFFLAPLWALVPAFAIFFLAEYANMILVSFLAPILFLGGWLSPFPESWPLLGAPGWWWLAGKVFVFATAYLWFRATFPRYRYDQIMRLGWKVFIPITIVWVFVAGCMKYFGWVGAGA
jgi:NADH:ubiquinone oxidoreductase subunit H